MPERCHFQNFSRLLASYFRFADISSVCVRLLQVFSLNLTAFYLSFHNSVAVLFTTEFSDSFSDCGQFACFNISDIEEQVVDDE